MNPKPIVRVKLTGSPIRRHYTQGATLLGLGLKKKDQIVEIEDTPAIRGMIRKVAHLVEILEPRM